MELTLRHLRVLCAVDDAGSISRAASTLGLSQPSLTAQLQRIEAHLGFAVFDRTPHGTTPTRAGRTALADARQVVASMEVFRHGHASDREAGALRVGGHGPLLLQLVNALADRAAQGVVVRPQKSSRLLQLELDRSLVDYALVREYPNVPVPRTDGTGELELLRREPLFVGLARTSPLAARPELALVELHDQPWAMDADDDSGENELLARACDRVGFRPQLSLAGDDNGLARSWVGSGKAVALFEPRAAQDHELTVRPLRDDPVHARVTLRWRQSAALHPGPEEVFGSLVQVYARAVVQHDVYRAWWRRRGPLNGVLFDAVAGLLEAPP